MFWIPLLMAASTVVSSQKAKAEVKAQNKINATNTAIANSDSQGNSTISAAKGALSRFNQSVQTRDALKGYGDNHNNLETQRVKLGEKMTTGSFAGRIAAAEQQGQLVARSSGAGVGGSTVSMLSATMQLRSDIQQAEMDQQYSDNLYAIDDAEQNNLYEQAGITARQNVFLDDVAAAEIVGPAKIPTQSVGSQALQAGTAFMGAAQSTGEFSKGGSLAGVGSKVKSWFSPTTGANLR